MYRTGVSMLLMSALRDTIWGKFDFPGSTEPRTEQSRQSRRRRRFPGSGGAQSVRPTNKSIYILVGEAGSAADLS